MPEYEVLVAGPAPTARVKVWVEDDTTDSEEIEWQIASHIEELDSAGRIDWELGDPTDIDILDYFTFAK